MYINNKLVIGKNDENEVCLIPKMLNRHGLITGASGSGKTTTVKVMAETISASGVPVFYVDVKGDLASICKSGETSKSLEDRINLLGLDNFLFQDFPTTFFDVFGEKGHPIRTTIFDIGARLLSRMLGLSDTQEGVLAIVFQIARDDNLELIDLDDLKSLLSYIQENRDKYSKKYGTITSMSLGAIQREILVLEQEGGASFFGKPKLELNDFLQYDSKGYGYINVFDAVTLFKKPTLYAVFLIWLLNNLFDNMPEVGDVDKPKLVLFLDEAHLIFSEMPSHLIKQITQVVKLIRSKGIGIYFISQSPKDIPDEILSQLGNKVQHVLRSYTPADENAIKAISLSFRANPAFDTASTIKSLATGEAVVSFLNENGEPNIIEKVSILPPQSYMGTITDIERDKVIRESRIYNKYETLVNDESAYEKINSMREVENKSKEKIQEEKKKSKEEIKAEKEKERIMKRVTNKMIDKTTTKVVNSLWKKIFK